MKQPPKAFERLSPRPLLLACVLAITLGACADAVQVRGNIPDEGVVATISPGVHSRIDVQSLLGSPSTVSTFEDNKWYYIGQKTTQFAFFEPEVLERKVLVVSFDEQGRVAATKAYGLEDGKIISPVDRITPTEGREMTVVQQLLGNVGRFTGGDN